MQGDRRRRWATVGTLVLLVHALAVAGRLAWKEGRRVGRTDHDGPAAEANTSRARALAAALPPRGVIGFLGAPRASTGDEHFDALQHPELQQLQYELAPRVLVEGAGPAVVVVALNDSAGARAVASAHGLEVVLDLGGGLLVTAHGPDGPPKAQPATQPGAR